MLSTESINASYLGKNVFTSFKEFHLWWPQIILDPHLKQWGAFSSYSACTCWIRMVTIHFTVWPLVISGDLLTSTQNVRLLPLNMGNAHTRYTNCPSCFSWYTHILCTCTHHHRCIGRFLFHQNQNGTILYQTCASTCKYSCQIYRYTKNAFTMMHSISILKSNKLSSLWNTTCFQDAYT